MRAPIFQMQRISLPRLGGAKLRLDLGRAMLEACLRHGVGGIPEGRRLILKSQLERLGFPPSQPPPRLGEAKLRLDGGRGFIQYPAIL